MNVTTKKTKDALKVAKLYYQQDFSQVEIATLMHISRPTVSRLLQYARESGLVRIDIADPSVEVPDLADRIRQKYGLKHVEVVPIATIAPKDRIDTVGETAADYIESIVQDDDVIGLGWGRTLYAIGTHLAPKDVRGVTVVQIKGSISNTESNNFAFESANAFAAAFHTLPQYLPLPVIFDRRETRELVEQETYISHIFDMGRRANIAIFTVGSVQDSALLFRLGYLTRAERDRLQHEAVGDVLSRFIDRDGGIIDEDIDARTIGLHLDDLKNKPHSILVAASPIKVPATHGALVAGYANTLVIDEISAADLLEFAT
ncbi:sugar-binding transcriptional regulator [Bifidobacterium simiarum]|uniref:sugar-binding transcriptional regulator n=1 Tax=Bifidobacterium simiarum TaxID=2045441 RepID=UPI001BDD7821|nr:sugar-binding transcriptional regulator [Bifidobacterium simiarum]MBT1165982.1 sugar-binding transcriptional regulator [Bifidobacterium simiarum]